MEYCQVPCVVQMYPFQNLEGDIGDLRIHFDSCITRIITIKHTLNNN